VPSSSIVDSSDEAKYQSHENYYQLDVPWLVHEHDKGIVEIPPESIKKFLDSKPGGC